ncbi:DUF6542 domain-containing protein [Mycobacterium lacus]|uniref:DUF6542 domain-containing protein n=1 Tax=Mycobacterium lacus TaxID=169765 RepID=UPI000A247E0A|nr:DUF6542 domain-containing protein [Mycobacterium lacus]MCV7122933.1 hypothetical protein [Mycobacterium lacus]ORW14473.1 hypothetical protein AWC15_13375 [Mycobacterium lacus]
MSAQRARSVVEPSHRSILPSIPGVPWWAAVLIATGATAVGYALDASHKELTHVFAALYLSGCVAAVLAVRQAGVFTAVIQPPLILFCAVPGAYWLFHGGKIGRLKDLLINCGYPLIERFPLMLGTAGGVLLIGLVRWYFGMSHRASPTTKDGTARAERTSLSSGLSGLRAKLASILGRDSDDQADEAPPTDSPLAHKVARPAKTRRAAHSSRSANRTTRTRSRYARPPLEATPEPPERPRRQTRRGATPPRDFDAADPPRRSRRRSRPEGDPDLRTPPPREVRRDPHPRRSPYERPAPRSSRFDSHDRLFEPPGPAEPFNRYERYGATYEPYAPPYEPYEPPRRRAAPPGSGGANPTHHPISRVRYRGQPPRDEPRAEFRDEPRVDRRGQSRAPRRSQGRPPAESWEYDV